VLEALIAADHVRTPEGAKKYGQPIGAVITKDVIERAARVARALAPGGAGEAARVEVAQQQRPGRRDSVLHRIRSFFRGSDTSPSITAAVDGFSPRTFQSDAQAGQYALNRAVPGRFGPSGSKTATIKRAPHWSSQDRETVVSDSLVGFHEAQTALREGKLDDPKAKEFIARFKRNSAPTTDDLIVSRRVGLDAFPGGVEGLAGHEIHDEGYFQANLGTPIGSAPVLLTVAVPKGTRVMFPGNGQQDRGVILDRGQRLHVTKVTPNGKGGFYVAAVIAPEGGSGKSEAIREVPHVPGAPQPAAAPEILQQQPTRPEETRSPTPIPFGARPGQQAAGPGPRNEPVVSQAIGTGGSVPQAPELKRAPIPEASKPSAPEVPKPGRALPDETVAKLNDPKTTVAQMREIAKEHGIKVPSKVTRKADIRDHLLGKEAGKPEPGPSANLEQAARDRQVKLDRARSISSMLVELDELQVSGASPRAMEARLRSRGKTEKVPDATIEEFVAAGQSGDQHRINSLIDKTAKEHGLTRDTGRAGSVEAFDRKKHESISGTGDIKDGQQVHVVRPGYTAEVDGEKVRAQRAVVERATPEELKIDYPEARDAFKVRWQEAGIIAPAGSPRRELNEVYLGVRSGKLSPAEGARQLDSGIEIDRHELADIEKTLKRTDLTPADRKELKRRAAMMRDSIDAKIRAAKLLRGEKVGAPAKEAKKIAHSNVRTGDIATWKPNFSGIHVRGPAGKPVHGRVIRRDGRIFVDWENGRQEEILAGDTEVSFERTPIKAARKATPSAAKKTAADAERAAQVKDFARRYTSGESIKDIASSSGRSYSTVHKMLVDSGVQLRPRGAGTAKKAAPKPSAELHGLRPIMAPPRPGAAIPATQVHVRPELAHAIDPPSLAKATQSEFRRITGRDLAVDIEPPGIHVSMPTAREHMEGILRSAEAWPDVELDEVRWFGGAPSTPDRQQPWAFQNNRSIMFNSYYLSVGGRSRYLREMDAGVAAWELGRPSESPGFHPRGSNHASANAAHEFAHILDHGGDTHLQVQELLERRAKEAGIPVSRIVRRDISGYAAQGAPGSRSNIAEVIAEAFVDVAVNGDKASRLSKEIVDLLRAAYRARHSGRHRKP
jgi:hypothetical protein